MADSDSVRQRRARHHRQGDHSLCRSGCQDGRASPKIAPVESGSGGNLDPSRSLAELAARLEAVSVADPANMVAAKELRQTLMVLLPSPTAGVDAEFKLLMAELSKPVPVSETRDWLDDGA